MWFYYWWSYTVGVDVTKGRREAVAWADKHRGYAQTGIIRAEEDSLDSKDLTTEGWTLTRRNFGICNYRIRSWTDFQWVCFGSIYQMWLSIDGLAWRRRGDQHSGEFFPDLLCRGLIPVMLVLKSDSLGCCYQISAENSTVRNVSERRWRVTNASDHLSMFPFLWFWLPGVSERLHGCHVLCFYLLD